MSDAALGAGHVVAGRYRLIAQLGQGGMGSVWRADHVTLRSAVAVKLLHRGMLDDEDGLRRFLAEAQAAAMLRSPHVVQILDHGVDEGTPYIAMELLEGESLASRLAKVRTLSLGQTARLVTHVARAVGKAHDAGIVHRDLKPDNVFLVENDDEEVAKVLDFGIAKIAHGLGEPATKVSTKQGSLLGTPFYMSPEQVRGHAIDWRSDLWSLGVIAFECVCGRVPFEGGTVGDLLLGICTEPVPMPSAFRAVPAAFDAWFAKAVARDIHARFQSAREMAEALRALVEDDAAKSVSGRFSSPMLDRAALSNPGFADEHAASAPTLDVGISVSRAALSISTRAGAAAISGAPTVAPGRSAAETMGGAASPSSRATTRAPWKLPLAALAIAALGVAAWLGLRSREATVAARGGDVASPTLAPTAAAGPPSAPPVARPTATAAEAPPAQPRASSSAAPASASVAPAVAPPSSVAPRPHASSRPAAPASPKKPGKDDLLF
jgi:serine/threonine-protein kinase